MHTAAPIEFWKPDVIGWRGIGVTTPALAIVLCSLSWLGQFPHRPRAS